MTKDKTNFNRIMAGLAEVAEIEAGRAKPARAFTPPADIDVKAIRKSLGLTQEAFAARFGLALGSLRDWEQGRSAPEASARVLLRVIEREPEAVERALSAA